jgi:hypothetical protein
MAVSTLSPLQLIAGAGLLQNQGLGVNANLSLAISTYNNTALISPLRQTITTAASGNVLLPSTLLALQTLAANSVPALSGSVPAGYPSITVTNSDPGLTGAIVATSAEYLGFGDLTKFVQALNTALSYTDIVNQFISSAVSSQTYLANTYSNMSDMITGDITKICTDTDAFGADLAQLGQLINLETLDNWGSPYALLRQIVRLIGNVPAFTTALTNAGVVTLAIENLNNPTYSVSDSQQKLVYQAMTQITGPNLVQILSFLKITTTGITTLADLLNPVKILPNSYYTLFVPTIQGSTRIYNDNTGSINSSLPSLLPKYITSSQA